MKKRTFGLFTVIAFASTHLIIGCGSSGGTIPEITRVLVLSPHINFDRVVEVFPLNMQGFEFEGWDIADSTPSVEHLHRYDVVLLFANSSSVDDSLTSNAVHDYVMDGGNAVLAAFYYYYRGNGYWGRLEAIDPVVGELSANETSFDTLTFSSSHPLFNGLDTLITYYHPKGYSVRAGATLLASYKNDNWYAAVNKPNGRIVAINSFPAEFDYQFSPRMEFFRQWENALLYAAWGETSDRPGDAGEPDITGGGGGETITGGHTLPASKR